MKGHGQSPDLGEVLEEPTEVVLLLRARDQGIDSTV